MKRALTTILTTFNYFLITQSHVFAQFQIKDKFQPASSGKFNTFGDIVTIVLTALTSLAGAIALIFIIMAGIKFVTSGGDQKKLASAQATITYAIIGIIVTALAFVILQITQRLVGSNVSI